VPELPEVETVRRDLTRIYAGRLLTDIHVTGRRTVRRHPPELLSALKGQVLKSVGRHGKYLVFEWANGEHLVAHLRMSGQRLAAQPEEPTLAHTHAVLSFEGAGELRFVDPRTFGEFFLSGVPGLHEAVPARRSKGIGDAAGAPELAHLGPDALEVTPSGLSEALAGRRGPLKSLLVDQTVLAGIGNIYADEICFEARLKPDRPGASLRPAELRRLSKATLSVLQAAIVARGSTLRDARYRDVAGTAGGYQVHHAVYGREGQPCLACGRPVQRVKIGAKSAYFCSRCQR
jgi:formamidopyrimidine-DNA glycosylase